MDGGVMQRQGEGKMKNQERVKIQAVFVISERMQWSAFSYLQGFSEERGGYKDFNHQTSQWRKERPTNSVWMQLLKREKVFVKTW